MADQMNLKEKVWKFAAENQNVPEIKFMLDDPDNVVVSEVNGCGIVNYIIRVKSTDGNHSVILKYGETYARHVPSVELGLRRQAREYEALKMMDRILPGSVPKPYCHDTKNNFICMEDMGHMTILGDDLLKGEISFEAATNIGQILAKMHQATAKENLSQIEWQHLQEQFGGEDMVNGWKRRLAIFQEDHAVVSLPEIVKPVYREHCSAILMAGKEKKLLEMFSQLDCFILRDNHFMSMFIENSRIVLFDFELAFVGNPMEQLAWAVSSYFICSKEAQRNKPDQATDIKDRSEEAFRKSVNSYFQMRDGKKTCEEARQKDMAALGFFIGGVTFFFAVVSGGEQLISLTDMDKIDLIRVGSQLLTTDSITSLDGIINVLFHPEE